MIPAHMDTTNAAAPLTDSVTTMLNTIVIVLCSLLPVPEAVRLVEVLRPLTPTLTLEFETLSRLLTPHGVTCTEMTEGGVLIKLTITVEADRLIPLSPDTLPHNGPQDKTPNPHIHLKEHPYPLEEVKDPVLAAGLQAPILLAALAAREVAVIQTAVQVMDHVHVLCSHQLHHSSLLWCLNPMNPAGVLELKCKIFQYGRLIQV